MTTNKSGRQIPKTNKKKRKLNKKKLLGWTFAAAALAIFCAMAGYIAIIFNGEKLLDQNINDNKMEMSQASILYDVNGTEISSLFMENREIVDYNEIPEQMIQALVATEDKRYYDHSGLDFWSIGRALYKDIVNRSAVEGGSTLTQQLAKNMFLSSDKTFFRKATEASIAVALEHRYTKDEILGLYLNRIFFGQRTYGIKTAAKKYFGKSNLKDLELWEMATLAGIPKAPSTYNPISNPEKSKERRAVVLKLMQEQGYITEQQQHAAAAEDYTPPASTGNAEYLTYIDYVTDEVEKVMGITEDELLRGGYKVYTTMDTKAQKIVEQSFANPKFFQKDGPTQKFQGSMVILNNQDGSLVAMIGGRDYVPKGFNRALDKRQPGSSFKPLVAYAPALEKGKWNPYSQLPDEKMNFNGYSPSNYDDTYEGSVNMAYAIKKSKNIAPVWLLSENGIGINEGYNFVQNKLGIPLEKEDKNLAIALGGLTKGVTPLHMARAYSAFANQGMMHQTYAITKILDSEGRETYRYKPAAPKKVMEPSTAWYMTEMLKDAVDNGTGQRAKMDRPVAGKTGSTGLTLKGLEKYDSNVWFVGYTPEWTAAVWMGFDKTDTKHYVTVGSGATAALFKEIMSKSLAGRKVTPFVKPSQVPDLKAPPTAITDLSAVYDTQERGVKLTWSSQEEKLEYKLFRKGYKEDNFKQILATPMTNIKDTTVTPGETYIYYVIPYKPDSDVEGDKSNFAEVAVPIDGSLPAPGNRPGDPIIDPTKPRLDNSNGPYEPTVPGNGANTGNGSGNPNLNGDGRNKVSPTPGGASTRPSASPTPSGTKPNGAGNGANGTVTPSPSDNTGNLNLIPNVR